MAIIMVSHITAVAQLQKSPATIKLINLYDAFGVENQNLTKDFGFSCLVECNGKTILFDAGTNIEIFEKNVKALKVDLRKVDIVVVSHGHYDHIGGMDYLIEINPKVKIYLPNDFFSLGAPIKFPFTEVDKAAESTLSKDEQYFGGKQGIDGMVSVPTGRFWKANVEYLTSSKEVLPGVRIVPTTSSLMGTFIKYPPFEENPQFIGMPELTLSVSTSQGQMILSGCSHSTIETIVAEVIKINKEPILLIAGGFHLIPYNREYIDELSAQMHDTYHVKYVAPAHCTGHLGFSVFKQIFKENYKFFGLGQTLQF